MTTQHRDDLLDHLWVAVIVTDADGVITGWNRHATVLYGYDADEAVGRTLFDLIIVDSGAAVDEMARIAGGARYAGTFMMRDKAGREFLANCRTVAVPDGSGAVASYVGVSFEVAHHELTPEEQMRLASAERTAEQLSRLQSVSAALVGVTVRDEVADVVVAQGVDAFGASAGSLAVVEDDHIRVVQAVGYPAGTVARFSEFPLDADVPIAHAVRTGEVIWLESRDALARRFPDAARQATVTQASAAIPLKTESGVIGCIGLSFDSGRTLTADERIFAETLASQCAQALERARLLREAQDALALLDTLLWTAPVGLAFFDGHGRFVRVNERLAQINGVPAEAHIGRTVPEVLEGMPSQVPADLVRVIETGEAVVDREVSGETPAAPGVERTWIASYYPVRSADGAVFAIGAVVFEITDRKRADVERERLLAAEREARAELEESQERLSFLTRASTLLASSLDYEATLRRLAQLAVPTVADWCVVHMVDEGGVPRPLAVAHVDEALVEELMAMTARYPADPDAPVGVAAAVRSHRPEFYGEVTDEMLCAVAVDDEHLAQLRRLGLSSGMTVPLLVRGRVIGALALANQAGRTADADDLALAEELATRASQAIENSLLYRERSEIARTLQASLLPPRLPAIDGVELGARYLAAGGGGEVGGDFYDAFLAAPGRWLLVIGDVQGKGVHAAAITGLARHTIRSFALVNDDPCDVLRHLNDVLLLADDGVDSRFCTVCVVRVEPHSGGAHLTACSAGHPLPMVVRAGGTAGRIGAHGSLLGVLDEPELISVAGDLAPGDRLVFVTDGVTERHEDQHFLEDDLLTHLSSMPELSAAELAERVETLARDFVAGEPRDDMAVLVLRVPPS